MLDGACALCSREGRMLMRLDKGKGRLATLDIASPTFDPAAFGLTHEQVMARIHARTPDGHIITGVEVFRRAYAAVGLGFLLAWTAWWPFRPIVDRFYIWFANHRLQISALAAKVLGGEPPCADGSCALPRPKA
jgi:predicted DCC family thiol-disulfide oxidoreductase YuxK